MVGSFSDLLRDPDDGVFYVFFDNNQRLYKQIGNVPNGRAILLSR